MSAKSFILAAAAATAFLATPAVAGGLFGGGYTGYSGYNYDGDGTAFARPCNCGAPMPVTTYAYVPVTTYRAIPVQIYNTPTVPPYYNVPTYGYGYGYGRSYGHGAGYRGYGYRRY